MLCLKEMSACVRYCTHCPLQKAFLLELFQSGYQGCQLKVELPRIFCNWGSHDNFEVMASVGKEDLHCDRSFHHSCGVICSVRTPMSPVLTDRQWSHWHDVRSSWTCVSSSTQMQLSGPLGASGSHKLSLNLSSLNQLEIPSGFHNSQSWPMPWKYYHAKATFFDHSCPFFTVGLVKCSASKSVVNVKLNMHRTYLSLCMA